LRTESQEEGLLLGLDNLINDWEAVAQNLEVDSQLFGEPAKPSCCKLLVDRQKEHVSQAFGSIRAWLKDTSLHKSLLNSK
jgi:hypothetical protein